MNAPRRGSLRCAVVAAFLFVGGGAASAADPGAVAPQPFPVLRLPDLDLVQHSLDEWRGSIIVLNFWASWCAPCQSEIPTLVANQAKFGGRGLQIVGVGLDRTAPLRNVGRTLGVNYPILVADPERQSEILARWGDAAGVIPYTVFIDRRGATVYTHSGPLDRDELHERLSQLLAAPPD